MTGAIVLVVLFSLLAIAWAGAAAWCIVMAVDEKVKILLPVGVLMFGLELAAAVWVASTYY